MGLPASTMVLALIALSDSGASTVSLRIDPAKTSAGRKDRTARLTTVDEQDAGGLP